MEYPKMKADLISTLTPVLFKKAETSEYVRRNLSRVAEALLAGDIPDSELMDEGCILAEKAAMGLANMHVLNQWFGPERVKQLRYRYRTGFGAHEPTETVEWLLVERKNVEARSARRRCMFLGLEFVGLVDQSGPEKPERARSKAKKEGVTGAKAAGKRQNGKKTVAAGKKVTRKRAK